MWTHTELCLASTQLDWLEQEENLKSFWKNIRHLLGLDTDFGYVLFGQHELTWKLSGRLCKSKCSPESLTNLKLGFLKWFFRSPPISLNLCPQNAFSQHRDQRKSLWHPVLLSFTYSLPAVVWHPSSQPLLGLSSVLAVWANFAFQIKHQLLFPTVSVHGHSEKNAMSLSLGCSVSLVPCPSRRQWIDWLWVWKTPSGSTKDIWMSGHPEQKAFTRCFH